MPNNVIPLQTFSKVVLVMLFKDVAGFSVGEFVDIGGKFLQTYGSNLAINTAAQYGV